MAEHEEPVRVSSATDTLAICLHHVNSL